MKPVGDFFSVQASVYAQARPHYPKAFYEYFRGLVDGDGYIADIGAGSGQATYDLAKWFSKVIAIEPSERVIANLHKQAEIYPVAARAENLPIKAKSLSGVICAQAAHWFDLALFCDEMRRCCLPNSPIAFLTYSQSSTSPEIDEIMADFNANIIGNYWPEGRAHVDNAYRDLVFPFDQQQTVAFDMTVNWDLDGFMNYVSSWSAVAAYKAEKNEDPVISLRASLAALWRGARAVQFPLTVKVMRVGPAQQENR